MSAAFSPAQLRASLWAGQGVRVHAVIDGLVVPDLAAMLAKADIAGWDCLQRGALSPEATAGAAYLAELKEESPFTDWLLDTATPTYPGWGVLSVSTRTLLPMREHCRALAEVLTPDGERHRWRWWDAEVVRTLLPTLLASQLDEFFALGQKVVVPTATDWTWLEMRDGVLATDTRTAMPSPR
jgi:uncharacterized protein DUF4123